MTYSRVNYGLQPEGLRFPAMPEETMGSRIVRQMEVKNLNQSDLAKRLGVTRMTVSQWCRDVSKPRPEQLGKLAIELFDGDALYLIFGPNRAPAGGLPRLPIRRLRKP